MKKIKMKWFTNSKVSYFVLGDIYLVQTYQKAKIKVCKLIKVTEYGYNLLELSTNKCILKRHLYVDKYTNEKESLVLKEKGILALRHWNYMSFEKV